MKNLHFKGKFRSYQQKVLDNLNAHLKDNKLHIFAAPAFYFKQDNPEVKVLTEALNKKGKQLNYEAAYAYDTMKMFIIAVEHAKEKTPAAIAAKMMSLSPYYGITGEIRLNENRVLF